MQCGSGVRAGETETVVLVSGFVKLETIDRKQVEI